MATEDQPMVKDKKYVKLIFVDSAAGLRVEGQINFAMDFPDVLALLTRMTKDVEGRLPDLPPMHDQSEGFSLREGCWWLRTVTEDHERSLTDENHTLSLKHGDWTMLDSLQGYDALSEATEWADIGTVGWIEFQHDLQKRRDEFNAQEAKLTCAKADPSLVTRKNMNRDERFSTMDQADAKPDQPSPTNYFCDERNIHRPKSPLIVDGNRNVKSFSHVVCPPNMVNATVSGSHPYQPSQEMHRQHSYPQYGWESMAMSGAANPYPYVEDAQYPASDVAPLQQEWGVQIQYPFQILPTAPPISMQYTGYPPVNNQSSSYAGYSYTHYGNMPIQHDAYSEQQYSGYNQTQSSVYNQMDMLGNTAQHRSQTHPKPYTSAPAMQYIAPNMMYQSRQVAAPFSGPAPALNSAPPFYAPKQAPHPPAYLPATRYELHNSHSRADLHEIGHQNGKTEVAVARTDVAQKSMIGNVPGKNRGHEKYQLKSKGGEIPEKLVEQEKDQPKGKRRHFMHRKSNPPSPCEEVKQRVAKSRENGKTKVKEPGTGLDPALDKNQRRFNLPTNLSGPMYPHGWHNHNAPRLGNIFHYQVPTISYQQSPLPQTTSGLGGSSILDPVVAPKQRQSQPPLVQTVHSEIQAPQPVRVLTNINTDILKESEIERLEENLMREQTDPAESTIIADAEHVAEHVVGHVAESIVTPLPRLGWPRLIMSEPIRAFPLAFDSTLNLVSDGSETDTGSESDEERKEDVEIERAAGSEPQRFPHHREAIAATFETADEFNTHLEGRMSSPQARQERLSAAEYEEWQKEHAQEMNNDNTQSEEQSVVTTEKRLLSPFEPNRDGKKPDLPDEEV